MAQNSAFSELILLLQERIKTEVPDIRMVDEDKGQLEDIDPKNNRPPVSWPCLLIDFQNCKYDDLGELVQTVDGALVLRLGFPPYSSAASWMPTATKVKALRYFDIEWQVYKALHGWQPEGFGTLLCRSSDTEKRMDAIRVRELRYELTFEEHSAELETDIRQLPPDEYNTGIDN